MRIRDVLGAGLLLALFSSTAPSQPAPAAVRVGDSAEMVKKQLGKPLRISRQVLFLRSLEQWHYGPPHSLRLELEAERGRTPRVTIVRPLVEVQNR
jgi:hypothetical protein